DSQRSVFSSEVIRPVESRVRKNYKNRRGVPRSMGERDAHPEWRIRSASLSTDISGKLRAASEAHRRNGVTLRRKLPIVTGIATIQSAFAGRQSRKKTSRE